jgi:DNA polymerase III subunit gamma/tau
LSYQVIARKYRPQSFDQMVGQNHITQTINNALKNNRLPHALLFTGLRGTGKTSSARILAKTLRCTQPVNFAPCNQCANCVEIAASRSVDVIEIDGASNNGVDAIRDLRDNVMFAPSSGKYKIFIIDEVHMLSTSAFNALLKTLEEPPAHVVFILATTEVHKIPQTILSRCQRFDFRRIPLKQVSDYLQKICELEGIKADAPALWLIAKQGEGSMRDSLSLLDQVISFTNANLSEAQVSQVLGLTERTLVFEVFDCLLQRKAKEMVSCLERLSISGQNPALFLEDISKLVRHSLLLKTDATATDLVDLPEDEIGLLIQKTMNTSYGDLHMLFDMLLKAMQDLKFSDDVQIVFEVALLRMSQAPHITDLKALLSEGGAVSDGARPKLTEERAPQQNPIAKNSATSDKPAFVAPPTTGTAKETQNSANLTYANGSASPAHSPADQNSSGKASAVSASAVKAPPVLKDLSIDEWLVFTQKIKAKDAFFGAQVENLLFLGCKGFKITLQPPQKFEFLTALLQTAEMRQKLQGFIDSEIAQGYTFEVLKSSALASGESASTLANKKVVQAEEKLMEKWQSDPRIQKAKEVFKGEIKVIKRSE